ncbi:histone-lysine N-methyltransferase prdm9 [Plakobranchus ocellatus]|uniref:Histone-lysine N-methyltransferase prdm9 n=1 Tax=Plakobranchus ocellatus TaxID=259542 RepID=A0AAV4ADW1_9GAST|nr:histone-lysine N-methyltransferase prdm9 [Plakobranchus ocellatus]
MSFASLHVLREHINTLTLETGTGIDLETLLNSKLVRDIIEQTRMPVLCLVCHISKVRLVACILEQGIDVNACGKDGMTPLHIVCCSERSQHAHLKIAAMLVRYGARLDSQDSCGSTPLLLACHSSQMELVKFLLANGCRTDIPDNQGETPFSVTCRMATDQWYFWNTECMNNMLEEDTSNLSDSLETSDRSVGLIPLDEKFQPLVICKLLLKAGVNPAHATFLPTAVLYGTVDTVRELLQLGMNVNLMDNNGSPLGCSCKASHVPSSVVKLLLEHGADVNEANSCRKEKPIILAYVFNFIEKICMLLSFGAKISPEQMSELVSISISKWFLESPDIVYENSKELLALKLLQKAGFRPLHSLIAMKLNRIALCSSYTRIQPWIFSLLFPMLSLADRCRIKIRSQLPPSIDDNVEHLPLPTALKNFLRFAEFSQKHIH